MFNNDILQDFYIFFFNLMPSVLYIGLDIGGTLSKVALASQSLNIQPFNDVKLRNRKFAVHLTRFNDVYVCLDWLKERTGQYDCIKLSVTGGGAAKYKQIIDEKFHNAQRISMNENIANTLGFNFIKQGQIPIVRGRYIKNGNQVTVTKQKSTLKDCQLPLLFICIGSGVGMNKIDQKQNGFEKVQAGDSSMGDGTCIGSAYIFGLIRLLSQQKDPIKIVELIKTNDVYRNIYEELLTNKMKLSLEASKNYNIPTIVPTGSIFRINPPFEFFERAIREDLSTHLERQVVSLEEYEGYLGTIGLLHDLIRNDYP